MDSFKLGYITKDQGLIIADNIATLSKTKSTTADAPVSAPKLKQYTANKGNAMLLTLGRKGGVSLWGGFVLGNFVTRNIKSGTLFTDMVLADLNGKKISMGVLK